MVSVMDTTGGAVCTVQDLAHRIDSLEAHVRKMGNTDGGLRAIEDKLDKLALLLQSDALSIFMNLSLEDSCRLRAALHETGLDKPSRIEVSVEPGSEEKQVCKQQAIEPQQHAVVGVKRDEAQLPTSPKGLLSQNRTPERKRDETMSLPKEDWFPSWALREISGTSHGEWEAVSPLHPIRVGAITKVVEPFRTSDETSTLLTPGMKCHVVRVDSAGDILVYCPEFAQLDDLPRWVGQEHFGQLEIFSPREKAEGMQATGPDVLAPSPKASKSSRPTLTISVSDEGEVIKEERSQVVRLCPKSDKPPRHPPAISVCKANTRESAA